MAYQEILKRLEATNLEVELVALKDEFLSELPTTPTQEDDSVKDLTDEEALIDCTISYENMLFLLPFLYLLRRDASSCNRLILLVKLFIQFLLFIFYVFIQILTLRYNYMFKLVLYLN